MKKILKIIFIVLFLIILYPVARYFYYASKSTIQERYDFSKAISVTVYDIDPRRFPQTDLEHIYNTKFDLNLFKELIPKAKVLIPFCFLDEPGWKGGSLAIVKFSDNTELRLAVSYINGFFNVIRERVYYRFEYSENENSDFERWYKEYHERIVQKSFIPNRAREDDD